MSLEDEVSGLNFKIMADIVRELSFQFALDAIQLYKFLTTEKREFVLSKQFLRSATSVGANLREAKNAQSAIDFIHKMQSHKKNVTKQYIGWNCFLRPNIFPKRPLTISTQKQLLC